MEDSETRIAELEKKVVELQEEQQRTNQDYCQKRAVLKELFVQKEREVKDTKTILQTVSTERDRLLHNLNALQTEIQEMHSVATVSELGRQDEVDLIKSKLQEEAASMQHIMKQGIAEEVVAIRGELDQSRIAWEKEKRALTMQLEDAKREAASQEESVLASVAKSLKRQMKTDITLSPSPKASSPVAPPVNPAMEEAMKKAQHDTDILKSIVVPYEEEIKVLKNKVREAYYRIDELEGVEPDGCKPNQISVAIDESKNDEQVKPMDNEHKNIDLLRIRLQKANDQFLESQRIQIIEMQRIETILTEDQKRQLQASRESALTSSLDTESPTHQRKIKHLLGLTDSSPAHHSSDPNSLNSAMGSREMKKSISGDQINHVVQNKQTLQVKQEQPSDTQSLYDFDTKPGVEEADDFFAPPRRGGWVGPGRRVVSEKEWSRLQLELEAAKKRIGGVCQMCSNYEDQLQTLQGNFQKRDKKLRIANSQLESEQQLTTSLRACQEDLENQLKTTASAQRERIDNLTERLNNSTTLANDLTQRLLEYRTSADRSLHELTQERERAVNELARLEHDYDTLLGRRSVRARQLRDEAISLPEVREDMELLVLQIREDMISAYAAKEQIEETLKGEIAFLKEQIRAEQAERTSLEESMSRDLAEAQDQLALQASCCSEYERELKVRAELEARLADSESKLLAGDQAANQSIDTQLRLESETKELRQRVGALQSDLENSELVQKDFVQLSQTLQIQLERLRQEEQDVRWIHDDDVHQCAECRTAFSMTRKKYHCRHCGKVFCTECLNKTVFSGPNKRPCRVCSVCHTMLVKSAVPYFSQEHPKPST